MDDKGRTPEDLLSSLLTGKKDTPGDSEKLQEKDSHTKTRPSKEKTQEPVLEPSGKKTKATYYLDDAVLLALDEAWLELRKMAINKQQISKSWIVEQAIQMAIEELRDKGSKSKLAKKIPKK